MAANNLRMTVDCEDFPQHRLVSMIGQAGYPDLRTFHKDYCAGAENKAGISNGLGPSFACPLHILQILQSVDCSDAGGDGQQ